MDLPKVEPIRCAGPRPDIRSEITARAALEHPELSRQPALGAIRMTQRNGESRRSHGAIPPNAQLTDGGPSLAPELPGSAPGPPFGAAGGSAPF